MFREYIIKNTDKNARILEFGPLNRPIFKKDEFLNVKYADIKSTDDVKKMYGGNEYLKKTGIRVDIDSIVNIDYVINKSYKEYFKNTEKFDVVVLSHVIEHMTDIINFFEDVAHIIKPNGKLIIIYPDKRFCFDHYRNSISFREALYLHENAEYKNYLKADFLSNVVENNNPVTFWEDLKTNISDKKKNTESFINAFKGSDEDVHYFPFDALSFYKFLIDMTQNNFLSFKIDEYFLTEVNTQEFLVILKKQDFDKKTIINEYYDNFNELIEKNKILEHNTKYKQQVNNIMIQLKKLREENNYLKKEINSLENCVSMKITKPLRTIKNIIKNKS